MLVGPASTAAATTIGGGCLRDPSPPAGQTGAFYCDTWTSTNGPRGSIALLGDSVLLGSSPFISSPSLVDVLTRQGWGPVRMTAAVGLQTELNGPGRAPSDVLDQWTREGVRPGVVAINLGVGYLDQCGSDPARCASAISSLVGAVHRRWPDAKVWWAKVVHTDFWTSAPSAGMVNWNRALDDAASRLGGRLVVWDWPAALAASGIITDLGNVHPASPTEYAKRSALLAAHLSTYMPARYVGPRVTVPAARPRALEYVPQRDATAGALPTAALRAGTPRSIDVARALPPSVGPAGVVLTVSSVAPTRSGWLRVHECGAGDAPASLLLFGKGQRRTTQAIVPLTNGTKVCALSNVDVGLRMSVQGALAADGGKRFVAVTPSLATLTTTATPGVRHVDHPALAASGAGTVAAAAVTVTVDGPSGGGRLTLHECGTTPPATPTLEFAPGLARSSAAYVPVGGGRFCMTTAFTGTAPRVRIAVTGVFTAAGSGARFRFSSANTRVLDMRPTARRGGWYGRHVATQAIGLPAAPTSAVAVAGVLTVYDTRGAGEVVAHPRALAGAGVPGIAFNDRIGRTVAPVTVRTGGASAIDLRMRRGNAQTAFDVIGWWTT